MVHSVMLILLTRVNPLITDSELLQLLALSSLLIKPILDSVVSKSLLPLTPFQVC